VLSPERFCLTAAAYKQISDALMEAAAAVA